MHIDVDYKTKKEFKTDDTRFTELYHQITSHENIMQFNDIVMFSGYDIDQIEICNGEIIGPDGKDVWDVALIKYEEMLVTGELKNNKIYSDFNIYDYKSAYNNFAKYNPFGDMERNPYKNLLLKESFSSQSYEKSKQAQSDFISFEKIEKARKEIRLRSIEDMKRVKLELAIYRKNNARFLEMT